MIINQNKIKTIKRHLPDGLIDQNIYVCIPVAGISDELLRKIGFSNGDIGQEIVPSPQFKRVTFFNTEGGYIRRTDLPKETVYREREWTWTDWANNEHSKTVYVPYQRYPRETVPAPEETFTIVSNTIGEALIISRQVLYTSDNEKSIKHIVNLFLEVFGRCEIRNARLDAIVPAPVVRLNWDILPKGATCWPTLLKDIAPALTRIVRSGARSIMMARLEKLNELNPDFVAVGRGGFYGYVIFGFENKSRFVLESIYSGNAIYVFGRNWAELSQLSKAEIINGSLQVARIVHQEGYWNNVVRHVA